MAVLTKDDVLYHQGSLLTQDGIMVASWDLEQQERFSGDYYSLAGHRGIHNAAASPFSVDYSTEPVVHVINGMGVTLGDSIIGLTALAALRELNPGLRIIVYRPGRAPGYVDQLYHMAAGAIAELRWLPWRVEHIPEQELCIDVGNQLFWPAFTTLPMIDFFLQALGVNPSQIPASVKNNGWMQKLCLPALPASWQGKKYVLFCPTASTPLRSIPASIHVSLVNTLWEKFACPVLGFGTVDHPHYVNIAALSPDTGDFLAWVKHASYVLTADTAAVHIAAGYAIPTTAFFTSIAPELRVRDYSVCQPVYLALPELNNVQASARKQDLEQVERAFHTLMLNDLPWA